MVYSHHVSNFSNKINKRVYNFLYVKKSKYLPIWKSNCGGTPYHRTAGHVSRPANCYKCFLIYFIIASLTCVVVYTSPRSGVTIWCTIAYSIACWMVAALSCLPSHSHIIFVLSIAAIGSAMCSHPLRVNSLVVVASSFVIFFYAAVEPFRVLTHYYKLKWFIELIL